MASDLLLLETGDPDNLLLENSDALWLEAPTAGVIALHRGRRQTQRPTVFVRNRNHWQSQGLEAWVPLGASGAAREMVRGNTAIVNAIGGALPPRAEAQLGAGLVFDGSGNPNAANANTFPSYAAYSLSTFTVTAVGLITTLSTSDTLWARAINTFTNGMWLLGMDASTTAWRFTVHDGTQRNVIDPTLALAQRLYYVVGVYDGPGLLMTLYVNGRSVATTSTIGGSPSAITQGLTVFSRSDNTGAAAANWVGACWDLRYYNLAWSAAQVAEWTEDPWGLYLPPVRRAFFDAAVAVATFQPAWARGSNQIVAGGMATL